MGQLTIYVTARNVETLSEAKELVTRIVEDNKGEEVPDVKPFHVSTRNDEERLRKELDSHRPCKVLCCVDNSARNIILSPTEPDEASQVVDAAEKFCADDGVFLLLFGHHDISDDGLYDEEHFDAILNRQPKLRRLVANKRFLSMDSNLNKGQEQAILNWIKVEPVYSTKDTDTVKTTSFSSFLSKLFGRTRTETPKS
ncbi:PREDICTED: uncharacterized protein LOC109479590 [Branchiostoma belcheri]|uniref:Uncharacterized protein LOC109479590 n=1 Tax=Branchiostoma belcheri TaxID=7741 RepID=A0A6P4ZSS6_BRABE|nr:PREDICTED: uncharacterized protein LOC109479590 [Branchiostoma belcheri]